MSKQTTIKTMFQVAFDNGVPLKATFDDVTIEAQPPEKRRCTKKNGSGNQCKNRVPLDSKRKQCADCRGIGNKSIQKRTAAFRADPAAPRL